MSCSKETVKKWESGHHGPDVTYIRALDAAYAANGVLAELAMAVDTPVATAIPPRRAWAHNFQLDGGPVWAWIRPTADSTVVRASITWGPVALTIDQRCDDHGVLITSPVSVKNPAVCVALEDPGWVDFGKGVIPDELGLPTIDGLRCVELLRDREYLYVAAVTLLGDGRFRGIASGASRASEALRSLRQIAERRLRGKATGDVWRDWEDLTTEAPLRSLAGQGEFSGDQFRELREARAMSRRAAANRASELPPPTRISEDEIRGIEEGRRSRADLLRARLDMAYRADGFTLTEPVRCELHDGVATDGATRYAAIFPAFWVGPVWITFRAMDPRDEAGDVELRWWPWRKRLFLRSGTTVTTRRGTPDLTQLFIDVPRGWAVEAGVGMHPEAIDVSHRWSPDRRGSVVELQRLYAPIHERLLPTTLRLLGTGGTPRRGARGDPRVPH
jgi:hypothetical protein